MKDLYNNFKVICYAECRIDPFIFDQVHIEVARNAPDDFKLFHDKHKRLQITHNPFRGPIFLGYQLNTLIEDQIRYIEKRHHEDQIIRRRAMYKF